MERLHCLFMCILLTTAVLAQNMVAYEYWFDQSDADGQRYTIQVSTGSTLNITSVMLSHPSLSLGLHQIHMRLKDSNGAWSSVTSRNFVNGPAGPYQLIAVRYWVGNPTSDDDPLVRTKYFTTPQTTLSYNGLLDLCGFPTGSQTLKLQLLDNHDQWSSVATRPITVNAAGTLGAPSITASSSTFCPGQVVTFTATPQSGPGFATPTGYSWQIPSGNGWSALPSDSSSIVVTIGDVAGNVQAAATNFCGIGPYGTMSVVIPAAPDQVPFINGPLQACVGSNAIYSVPVAVPGIAYTWEIYEGWTVPPTSGPSLPTVIGTANATISVIAQNVCGVQAPPRIESITVTAPPYAGIDGTLATCSNAAPFSLSIGLQGTPDTGGVWRRNGVMVSGIYNPSIDVPGVYTYTVSGSGPCPDATASVTVSETQAPNAGVNEALTLCSNAGIQIMTDALGGTPDGGGSWSGPSATNGLFDPATMLPGLYMYTVTGAPPCANASATLTISVNQASNAGVGGVLELCAGSVPMLLLNALSGSPSLSGLWTGPDGTAFAGVFTPGQSAEGVYTYTVQGSGACADDSAALDVNVMELQITEMNGPTSVPNIEQLLFWVLPSLPDADSILWTLPAGWDWGPDDNDPYDASAYVIPSATAGEVQVCAKALGGGCVGNDTCLTVDVTVGLAEGIGGAGHLLVYPNPNNGSFTVRGSMLPGNTQAQLLDALGQEVAAFRIAGPNAVVELDDLPSGTYMLRWQKAGYGGSQRVIVAR